MGTTVTPSLCFSPTGAGINDQDLDGMDDTCEQSLASQFRPEVSYSAYDCNTGGEPYWAAKYFPSHGSVVRIMYMFAYYQDCGTSPGQAICSVVDIAQRIAWVIPPVSEAVLVGILPVSPESVCAGHTGDGEFVVLEVNYNEDTQHWVLTHAFLSAHFQNFTDQSSSVGPEYLEFPQVYQGYPRVWSSEGKHANYTSRYACSNASYAGYISIGETCEGNPNHGRRMAFDGTHNVGSYWANMINAGTCVAGGLYHVQSPDAYGVECFWGGVGDDSYRFSGWAPAHQPADATPYVTPLIMKFECYAPSRVDDQSVQCDDLGVVR